MAVKRAEVKRPRRCGATLSPDCFVWTVSAHLIEPRRVRWAKLKLRRERWGLSYYVVHELFLDAFAPVVARLAGE
jgi:hypothetical protein